SEGLLLITTDNDFAKYAQSPDNGWERKYKVRLFGIPNEKIISALMQGIEINKIQYKPMQVRIISQSKGKNCWVDCALTEGKNREIRKVFEHFGIMVNKLIRYKYGPYELGNLTPTQLIEVNFKNI
ncbi:MAG: pseudouridine synthase, partial [Holosporales bacterium]|nr:pseudouridine synthase [Holosporales bacterium]